MISSRARAGDWGLVATLTLGMFCGTFSLAILSALGPFIIEDFALSGAQFGALSSVVFAAAALVSRFVGRRIDSFSGRSMLVGLTGFSGLVALAIATATGYAWLLAATAASGLAVAVANPATNALVSRYRVEGSRAWLLGFKQSGQPVSMLIAGFLLPPTAVAVGWRPSLGAVVACSLGGLALAVAKLPPTDEAVSGAAADVATAKESAPSAGMLAYAGLLGLGMSGVGAYLPVYAHAELGVGAAAAGSTAAAVGLAGIAGRLGWARATERRPLRPRMLPAVAVASIPAMVALLFAAPDRPWLIWVGAAGFGATAHSWNVVANIALLSEAPVRSAGQVSATVQTTFFAGLTVSPLLVGTLGDVTGTYRWAWVVMMFVYASASVTSLRTTSLLRPHVARNVQEG